MDVRFALRSITQNSQPARILQELPQEIKTHAVRLPWSNHIPKPEDPGGELEHVAVGTDEGFTGKLARSICRDRNERAIIFVDFLFSQIAVDAAARCVQDG